MKSSWETKRLRDLPVLFVDGDRSGRYPKRSEFVSEGILFLNAESITNGFVNLDAANFIAPEKFSTIKKGRLQRGDVLVTMRGNGVGKVAFFAGIPPTGLINAQMLIVRSTSDSLNPLFLYYLILTPFYFERLRGLATGSAQPQLSIASLRELEISIPQSEEQNKIASILSAYDDLFANNSRRIKILQEMAKTIYDEWFVKFHFPGHEKVKMVESELGLIPEGWEVKRLGEVCSILMGQSPKSEYYNTKGEGLPFHQGVTDFGERFPSTRVFCNIAGRVAEPGDILFSVRAPVGRINLADCRIVIGRGLSAIRNLEGFQCFTLYQLNYVFSKEDIIGGGTIFKAVTKGDMEGIKCLYPPKDYLIGYEKVCVPISEELAVLDKKNRILRRTRDLLLPKLISGEIDVENLDIKTEE